MINNNRKRIFISSVQSEFQHERRQLAKYIRQDALFKWYTDPDDVFDVTEIDLSVAQKLASKLGGFLHWDDTYKNGTRMEFVLPVR